MDMSGLHAVVAFASIVLYVRFLNSMLKPTWVLPQPEDPLVTHFKRHGFGDPTGLDPVDDPVSTSVMLDLGEL